uniref:Uncharacterized protein n=1 Tax=Lactuca sativa TaxID=4236 RepID=A0A9R1XCQ7_LACSA|nr:hypothetical protein LSAT_V11C500246710 [Lactuca sativa]
MFRQSCFGDYVNMLMGVECHPLLCHYLMCKKFTTLMHSGFAEFREHVFLFVPLSCSVSVADLMHVFNNLLHQLSNEDVVRVSLMYMLEQGFLGEYPRQPVTNEHMTLVHMRQIDMGFHLQTDVLRTILKPKSPRVGSRETYTLQGFVYAFKYSGSPIPGFIPRAVAYHRMRRLRTPDCQRILDVTNVCSLVRLIIYKLILYK